MPANLSPEYKAAEAAFRQARDPRERLDRLREMLRTIPKHKGTDHLQADIKRRIKELSEELEGPRKGGTRSGPPQVIQPRGAGQIALLGPPNTGKSALHARLTGSGAHVGPYPFTTQHPQPGMMPFEDIYFQLVDLPALSPEHAVPWLVAALQTADAAMLVVDLSDADCVDRVETALGVLKEKRVTLTERWPADATAAEPEDEDPFALRIPALLLANKADLLPNVESELQVFREIAALRFPGFAVSAETGLGLAALGPWLFERLGVIRVYTKTPGKPAEKDHPFALRRGQTIEDVARLVHHDVAESLRYARVWHASGFAGQQVGREHPVADGDIVELHA